MLRSFTSIAILFAAIPAYAQSPAALPSQGQQTLGQPQQAPGVAPINSGGQAVVQNPNGPAQLGQPGPVGQPMQRHAGPPFPPLGAVEQQFVDQILQMWEAESDKIKTFNSKFECWEYNLTFGPGSDKPLFKSVGQVTYKKPDKGSFKIEEVRTYKQEAEGQPGDWVLDEKEKRDHWICDGKSTFEYNYKKKQLIVRPIPPEMQGKEIVNGPLPFLFGAKADKLKQRFWIRSKGSNASMIHLEAYPRWQADAANYRRVEVMLDRKRMMPTAIQVHMPNGQEWDAYMFKDPKVNSQLDQLLGSVFNAPRTPLGWTRLVEELPTGQPQQNVGPHATAPQETQQR